MSSTSKILVPLVVIIIVAGFSLRSKDTSVSIQSDNPDVIVDSFINDALQEQVLADEASTDANIIITDGDQLDLLAAIYAPNEY